MVLGLCAALMWITTSSTERDAVDVPDAPAIQTAPLVEVAERAATSGAPGDFLAEFTRAARQAPEPRVSQAPVVPALRPVEAEPIFSASAKSGGLVVRLSDQTTEFELVAVMVPYLSEYRVPGFEPGPPAARTVRSRSVDGAAFVPYLGKEKILCWIGAQERGDVFENLLVAVPPAPPNEINLELRAKVHEGVVLGSVCFPDGRPAAGYEVRVNPAGSFSWEAPLDVHGPQDLRAAMGRSTTTGPDGGFEVVGLPVGDGGLVAVSLDGQVLAGGQNIAIVEGRERASPLRLTVPSGSRRSVAVTCSGRRIPGLTLYVSGEGGIISTVRCDRRGEASIFVPDSVRRATVGFPMTAFTTHRELRHALAEAGFPQRLQFRLFDLLTMIAGSTQLALEPQREHDKIVSIDLTPAMERLTGDSAEAKRLAKKMCSAIEGKTTVPAPIREALEAGRMEQVFLEFLDVFGTTAADLAR